MNTGSIQAKRSAPAFEKRPCMVPGWVLDKIADQQVTGGYVGARHKVCPECHTKKSSSGNCFC